MLHMGLVPEKNAKERGEKEALFFEDRMYTHNRFNDLVGRLARGLREKCGIGKGDLVALHLHNSAEFAIAMYAAWRIGAAVTPLNPALTADEISYQLRDSGAKVWIFDAQVKEKVADTLARLGDTAPARVVVGGDGGEEALSWEEVFAEEGLSFERSGMMEEAMEEIALVIYTSGTTGRPKGVMLSHSNLYHMVRSMVEAVEMTENDRALLILPLFHVNGIMVTLVLPLFVGGSTVILRRFHPMDFLAAIQKHRPTYFSAVPTIYGILLQLPEEAVKNVDFSSLRFGLCGAAPMPKDLFIRFEERYPVKILEGYGLSEGTVASTFNPLHGKRKIGSIGIPLPGQEVKIFDEQDRELPPGKIGEIVIRGKNVMVGYLNRPEATGEALRGGWLRSGDLGYKDEDGYIHIVDRKKDLIIRGGQNIYPAEVENVLYRHPAVYEAAVIGVPDEKYGEEVKAFVSLKKEYQGRVDEEEILRFCQEHLAYYKTPKSVEFLDELPKNSVGKIIKAPLRERV